MTPTDYITNVLPRMEGWCSPAKAERLVSLVMERKPALCVEIGVFGGRSLFTLALAQAALPMAKRVYGYKGSHNEWVLYPANEFHYDSGGLRVIPLTIGIDPWERSPSTEGYDGDNLSWWAKLDHDAIYAGCRATLTQLSLQDRCHLLRATSAQALSLVKRLAPLDLLHVDGNHSQEAALFDVTNYVPLVRPGGIVLFDDLGWSTTKPAQTHLSTLCRSLEIIDGCGVFERLP